MMKNLLVLLALTTIAIGLSATPPDFAPPAGVGAEDVQAVAARWRMTAANPGWDPRYDRDGNGRVDVRDILLPADWPAWLP